MKPRLTYANVMATVAVFIALGGSAVAAVIVSSNSQVARDTISGHDPPAGAHPNIIDQSLNATDLAAGAVTGGKLAPSSVGTAKFVPGATAPNASELGGRPPSEYQRRVTGRCGEQRMIFRVDDDGTVGCRRPIVPIAETPSAGEGYGNIVLGPQGFQMHVDCHSAFGTRVGFRNFSGNAGTLNWLFSSGGTSSTVNASGNVLASGGAEIDFTYGGARLEGQWIFALPGSVTTVNLHAFDGGSSCEIRGTAHYAAVP